MGSQLSRHIDDAVNQSPKLCMGEETTEDVAVEEGPTQWIRMQRRVSR